MNTLTYSTPIGVALRQSERRRRRRRRSHLEDGFHIGAYEAGCVGHQVTQHAGALLLVAAHTAVRQLRQDLDPTEPNQQLTLTS